MKDNETAAAYPLQWPQGWPRTPTDDRKPGKFGTTSRSEGGWRQSSEITISQAVTRIHKELEMMDGPQRSWRRINGSTVVISTNLRVRKGDGEPVSKQAQPEDPGAAVYFELDGRRQCVPCDSYTKVAQNLAGIAATLEALRALERHGSGLMERAFTGFEALPDPESINWRNVLGYEGDSFEECQRIYRRKASESHPDNGGSESAMAAINVAWSQAKEELKRGT